MSTTQHLTPADYIAALYYKKVSYNSDQCIWQEACKIPINLSVASQKSVT